MTGRRGKIHTPPHPRSDSVPLEKKQATSNRLQQSGSYDSYKEIIMKWDLNNHDSNKNTQSSVSFPAEGSAQPATTLREQTEGFTETENYMHLTFDGL